MIKINYGEKYLILKNLKTIIPGCKSLKETTKNNLIGIIQLSIGPVKGEYSFNVSIKKIKQNKSFEIAGNGQGELGNGNGIAKIEIINKNKKSFLAYSYAAKVDGKIMIVGNRLINSSVKLLVNQIFQSFTLNKSSDETFLKKLLKLFGIKIWNLVTLNI